MTAMRGQASAEYAGLLALAAVLGATVALIAGPPLIHALRNALVAVLSIPAHRPAPVVASAADIADVQRALLPTADAMTPEAALLALGLRHGEARAAEVADALLLAAARHAVPWLGGRRTYRAWARPDDGPYGLSATTGGDRDVETPTAAPVVLWITLAAQRRELAAAFAHHTSATALALDTIAMIPAGGLTRAAGAATGRAERASLRRLPRAAGAVGAATDLIATAGADDGGVPAGMRVGDVVVAWPVHRTFWRSGHEDPEPLIDYGVAGSHPPPHDYVHIVFLRPGAGGLAIAAEGLRA